MASIKYCGPLALHTLQNNDQNYPQNLFLSIVHQLFLKESQLSESPTVLLSQIHSNLQFYFGTNFLHLISDNELLLAIYAIYKLHIYIYKDHQRYTYQPMLNSNSYTRSRVNIAFINSISCQLFLEIYRDTNLYQSVLKSEIRQDFEFLREIQGFKKNMFKLSTWNLRGVTKTDDQLIIDYMLRQEKIDISAIQESHLNCSGIETSNYIWLLGPQYQSRASRGIGFLVSKTFFSQHDVKMTVVTPNIAYLTVLIPYVKPISIINIHKLCNNDPNSSLETGRLISLARSLGQQTDLIIVGDTNSHIGSQDASVCTSNCFGKFLFHEYSNSNGDDIIYMSNLLDLKVQTTMQHKSTKITWYSRGQQSQIDHIFNMSCNELKIFSVKGKWMNYETDHKLIFCNVAYTQDISQYAAKKYPSYKIYHTKQWDYKFLLNPQIQYNFNLSIERELREFHKFNSEKITWEDLCSIVCFCADKFIKKRKRVYTDEEKIAYQELKRSLSRHCRSRLVDRIQNYNDPIDDIPPIVPPGFREIIKNAQKRMISLRISNVERENLDQLLTNIQNQEMHPSQRVQQLMKYLKGLKRSQVCSNNITLKHWEIDLQNSIGPLIPLLLEDDYFPLPPPPSFQAFLVVIGKMKNGRAGGLDKICIEMFKASEELQYEFYKIIQRVYITNDVPIDWQQTYAYPIPKIVSPKTINDMRKITLTSTGYKVYVTLLKEKLEEYLPPLKEYQFGFTNNRSCDDMLFVIRRVLEERWNHGLSTYIFGYDMRQAFDNIRIDLLPEILIQHNVPKILINRIIKAVLIERTCIFWKGQYTQFVDKSKGVKQGCPLSPSLFNRVLDNAIHEVVEEISSDLQINICLGDSESNLQLPLLIIYADDINLLTNNIEEGIEISKKIIKVFTNYGLHLNASKSGILKKSSVQDLPPTVKILNFDIPVVDSMKILGVTFNSHMERKSSIKFRCNNAIRITKALMSRLSEAKIPITDIMRIYELVICPSLIYGLSTSSLTQQNQSSLMNREIMIIKDLASIAHPKPSQISIAKLLNFRTINRKVSVQRIRYYAHVKRRSSSSIISKAERFKVIAKRRVGRPLYTFNRTLLKDFEKYPLSDQEWEENFEYREIIKQVTLDLYKNEDLSDDLMSIDQMLYYEEDDEE